MLIYGIALLAGVVTAISPCAYPVLPIVFAGGASGSSRRPYAIVAGLVFTFLVFLLALTWIVDQLGLPKDLLRNISIALLLFMGAILIIPRLEQGIERPLARVSERRGRDLGGGFLLGASLGIVFAPCAGIVLTGVVGETASASGVRRFGVALAYALGTGLTLLAIALLARRNVARLRAMDVNRVRVALGVVIGLATLGIALNLDTKLQTKFPDYTSALQKAVGEKSCYARKHLGQRCLASRQVDSGPKAPNFTGISDWINSKPLTTQKLHGKVVLVDFWTYSCINCLRTLPHLKAWYAAYHKKGLEIVGVHTPEFAFEHVPSNVRAAVKRLGIAYPVVQDNRFKTWDNYSNQYWPAEYLIDKSGHVRHTHFGEGQYGETEQLIRRLLGVHGAKSAQRADETPTGLLTPETYLGYQRLNNYVGTPVSPDTVGLYRLPDELPQNTIAYGGRWRLDAERATAVRDSPLALHFHAKNVYVVLGGHGTVRASINGRLVKTIPVTAQKLYTVRASKQTADTTVDLAFTPGVQAYSFTFG